MITWKVVQLERQAQDGLVTVVHWEALLSETVQQNEELKKYNSRVYGAVSVERDSSFTPFEQLTEQTVIRWVKEKLGTVQVSKLEMTLQEQIEQQKSPPTLTGVPW